MRAGHADLDLHDSGPTEAAIIRPLSPSDRYPHPTAIPGRGESSLQITVPNVVALSWKSERLRESSIQSAGGKIPIKVNIYSLL